MHSKQDLIKHLSDGATPAYPTRGEAERAVNAVIDGIKDLVIQSGSEGVNLVGFGAFRKVERKARQGRNPKTGEVIQIEASRSVAFKVSRNLKDALL